jgi:tetratricopeptide (TPR) repeat protein
MLACSSPGERDTATPPPSSARTPVPATGLSAQLQEGIQLFRDGNFEDAAERFEAAAAAQPQDERILFYLGSARLQTKQHLKALEALDRALAVREDFLEARLARARVHMRMGNYPGAEPDLRRVLQMDPDNWVALFNLGFLLYRSGNYEEAIERLQQVIRLRPDHPDAPYYLGMAYMRLGDEDGARGAFEQAIRLNPDNPAVYQNLGLLLVRQGRVEEGERHLKTFKELSDAVTAAEYHQERINTMTLEAYLLQKEGKTDAAIEKYRKVLEVAPEHAPTHKDLAILYLAQNRSDEALAALERATEIDPDYAPPFLYLSHIYERLGQADRAAAAAERYRLLDSSEDARQAEVRRGGVQQW